MAKVTHKAQDIKKVPNLRFPEFEGEWKESTLESFIDIISGIPIQSEEILDEEIGVRILRGINITEGFIRHNKEIDRYYAKSITSKIQKYILEEKDLVLGMDGSKVGKNVALISKSDVGSILIQRVARIKALKNADINFIFQKIYSNKFQRYVDVVNTSSGIPHISLQQIKDFETCFPVCISEQAKIASFLSLIDERIGTQNKIIKELNVLKNTFIKRLFSEQLRFKMYDGNDFPGWQLMTLGDIGEVKMCRRIFNDETSPNGDIPFFKIGSFGKDADAFISKKLYENYRNRFSFPKKGDILISAAGTIGRTVVYNGEDAYYQDSNIVWIDNNNTKVLNKFLYYILQIVKYNTEGGTIQRLYNNILKSTKVNCPSLSEQKRIIDCLSSIDFKIELENKVLNQFEQQKKFLLQQMFV